MSGLLFDVAAVGNPHDGLDRFYTPEALALRCVAALADVGGIDTLIEPHVGGGAFVRTARKLWPGVLIAGLDVDPAAPGLDLVDVDSRGVDFLDVVGGWGRMPKGRAIVGNPPFGDAFEHVSAAVRTGADVVAFVLPLAFLGSVRWAPWLDEHPPRVVHRIVGRPWPANVREVAFYEWRRGWTGDSVTRRLP